ncbi:MAG: HEAT repeat domain-containing protein [Thermovenabulum sp.]|uniref:HEAT repeat domain-containing protein n=1 Tax=Thermovenabulum sp. TaxID=3100335 RepID=UPI003C7AA7D2
MTFFEKTVYYSLFFLISLLLLLYLYLAYLKMREMIYEKKKNKAYNLLAPLVDEILVNIDEVKEEEVIKLKRKLKKYYEKDIVAEKLIKYFELYSGEIRNKITMLCEKLGLVDFEIKRLKGKDLYQKAIACKRLGEYRSKKALVDLYEALKIDFADVKYHAALALAKIGDLEYFTKIFKEMLGLNILSERNLLEIVDSFEGDKISLYKSMIFHEDDFISSIFIKSAGNNFMIDLSEEISRFLNSKSFLRRIAAIKAIGQMGALKYIDDIIKALFDDDWQIRAVAAKALGELKDPKALPFLKKALSDGEWWVRYNSAGAIFKIGNYQSILAEVLDGEDKFAKDIILYYIVVSGKLQEILNLSNSIHEEDRKSSEKIREYLESSSEGV